MDFLFGTWQGVLLLWLAAIIVLTLFIERVWGWLGPRVLKRPINQRRWRNFRRNKRAWWSLSLFSALFLLSLFAEFIANDRPLVVMMPDKVLTPVLEDYTEADFGGTPPFFGVDYHQSYFKDLVSDQNGTIIRPVHSFDFSYIDRSAGPVPAPPSAKHPLGLDDTGRDVLARLIYGFRLSVLFALILTSFITVLGVLAGAIQGYFGGWVDLIGQRFIEIWGSIPSLFVVMIVAAIIQPTFWILLFLLLAFSWTSLVGVVRAEFLRGRNFEYVQAARALGASSWKIMFRHVLPNAMVATLTMMPFVLTGAVAGLASLDYLGFGLQDGAPSLGELARQGQNNATTAPWLAITAFCSLGVLLSLLVFIFEGVRDAFDPRKVFK